MFPSLPSSAVPVRLAITALIPIGQAVPSTIVVTCDPPSDRYEVVWHQDVMTDVFTPEEALDAISTMVYEALKVIETGSFLSVDQASTPCDIGHTPPAQMPGQLEMVV